MEDKIPPSPTSVFARVHDTEIFLLQRLRGPPQNMKHNSYVKKICKWFFIPPSKLLGLYSGKVQGQIQITYALFSAKPIELLFGYTSEISSGPK